jgi:hypothetical protein
VGNSLISKNSQMNLKLFFIALIISSLYGCNTPTNTTGVPAKSIENTYSLIFIDKTVSIKPSDNFIRGKYEKILERIVQQNIQTQGDKVEIYYVHENTAQAKVFAAEAKSTLSDTLGLNKTDVLGVKNRYKLSLKKEKARILEKCKNSLSELNETDTRKATDLWATINIIDKKNSKKKEKSKLKVYYFSDMVESMEGVNKRDFHIRPPYSKSEAEQWATQDAKRFTEIEIEGTNIFYILPYTPLSSTSQNNPIVIYYWERLFTALGIDETIELSGDE